MVTGARDSTALLARIEDALDRAAVIFAMFDRSSILALTKSGGDPITEVDLAIDGALQRSLLSEGDGWLSEETVDDLIRLDADLTWVVDPLDGTREFVDGLPEFCTSIAAVVAGRAVAGGVLNPAADIRVVGAEGMGLSVRSPQESPRGDRSSKRVLASRSEVERGQWEVVRASGWTVTPMGSVAYKLARVAAGLDPVTWTPVPKHEWDIAGGAALIRAAGGDVLSLELEDVRFNNERPWMPGAIAVPAGYPHLQEIHDLVERQRNKE